jgi:hypothetical protein
MKDLPWCYIFTGYVDIYSVAISRRENPDGCKISLKSTALKIFIFNIQLMSFLRLGTLYPGIFEKWYSNKFPAIYNKLLGSEIGNSTGAIFSYQVFQLVLVCSFSTCSQ